MNRFLGVGRRRSAQQFMAVLVLMVMTGCGSSRNSNMGTPDHVSASILAPSSPSEGIFQIFPVMPQTQNCGNPLLVLVRVRNSENVLVFRGETVPNGVLISPNLPVDTYSIEMESGSCVSTTTFSLPGQSVIPVTMPLGA